MIAAYTKIDSVYPGYINIKTIEDHVVITLRGDPTSRESVYICGYPRDKGMPGRCTPGDTRCNNYCNNAPEKGEMQDSPKECTQVIEGQTSVLILKSGEWEELLKDINKLS